MRAIYTSRTKPVEKPKPEPKAEAEVEAKADAEVQAQIQASEPPVEVRPMTDWFAEAG